MISFGEFEFAFLIFPRNRDSIILIVRNGKSSHLRTDTPLKTLVMKPTGVDSLSDPLCPEPDVRPRHNFHVNITLTSFPSSNTDILLSFLQNRGPS